MNKDLIQTIQFQSKLIKEILPYIAVLPENYFETDEKFPVFYLMHGLFGDFENWTSLTGLTEYAKKTPFIIICPEGKNSWYLDNELLENHLFESYILDELIPDVEERFRVKKERDSRIIGGLSMGGYGAFKFSFRRPQMFSFALSMSGAFDIPAFLANERNKFPELHPLIADTFNGLSTKKLKNEDLFKIAANFPAEKITQLPFFYFDCGKDDSFIDANRKFAKLLTKRGIKHRFLELEGEHGWNYWDKQIKFILEFLPEIIKKEKNIFGEE